MSERKPKESLFVANGECRPMNDAHKIMGQENWKELTHSARTTNGIILKRYGTIGLRTAPTLEVQLMIVCLKSERIKENFNEILSDLRLRIYLEDKVYEK